MRRPMLGVWVAFAAGVLVAEASVDLPAGPALAGAGLLLPLALVAGAGRGAILALLGAAASLGVGAAAVERRAYESMALTAWVRTPAAQWPAFVVGRAASDATSRAGRVSLLVEVERLRFGGRTLPMHGRARISIGGDTPPPAIAQGDRIAMWAQLRAPRGYLSPGARDAAESARRARVHAWGRCKTARLLQRREGAAADPERLAARVRAWARERFAARLSPGPERVIVRSMVLGDRGDLDEETLEAFRAAGTYHVLALSGAQVALVAGLLYAGLRRAGTGPAVVALVVAPAVCFYAVLVGGDVPVVRAAVMTAVVLVGRVLDQRADVANLLGVCGIVLLAERPPAAAEAGYQLSFLATLALALLTDRFRAPLSRLPSGLAAALGASLAAQLALAPVLVSTFHRFPPVAPLANLVAVPLSGGVLLAGLALLVADVVMPPLVGVAAWIAHALAAGLLASAHLAAAVGPDLRPPDPPLWGVVLFAGSLVALARGTSWRRAAVPFVVGLTGLLFGAPGPVADGRLHVSVLDVGQGDALVVRGPDGSVSVVDTGARYPSGHDLGREVVAPFLWHTRARRLHRLVLSHVQSDHVGGAAFLLRQFDVDAAWLPPAAPESRVPFAELHGGGWRSVSKGVREAWGGAQAGVLAPAGRGVDALAVNDRSLVVSLRLGEVGILLTGDIEAASERDLEVTPHLMAKVPHHGSRSSSTAAFVRRLGARFVVVSCGATNPFGHPAPEVIERWARHGALVLRTDRDGTTTLSTDGRRLWLRTAREPRPRRVL